MPTQVELIREKATKLGLEAFGVAAVEVDLKAEYFAKWIAEGRHAGMGWMDNPKRLEARTILPECKSVVVVGMNYYQKSPERQGQIATYALGGDYHKVLYKKLKKLCALMRELGGEQKPYVDTGPVLEKRFAAATQIGWQGKNTLLVSKEHGTWLALGVILTTLELPIDKSGPNRCGSCTRCLQACPTGALTGEHQLDARRCIAYLTIEHTGIIPEKFEEAIGNKLFGCDECLRVCPWNKWAVETKELGLKAREYPSALEILGMDEETFTKLTSGSPVKRLGLERLQRNACVVLGNIGGKEALRVLERLESSESEILRGHAARAIKRIQAK